MNRLRSGIASFIVLASACFPISSLYANAPENLSSSDWQSIRQQIDAAKFRPSEQGTSWRAENPVHGFSVHYGTDGSTEVSLGRDNAELISILPKAVGYGASMQTLGLPQRRHVEADIVQTQWNRTLREWWVNGSDGLEQWFELTERPAAAGSAPLSVQMAIKTSLQLAVRGQGDGQHLQLSGEGTNLQFAKLRVWDADQRRLPAQMVLKGSDLVLQIDDQGARFPITIDPTLQQAYLKASNTGANDRFGVVAVSGDTIVVGATGEDSDTTGVNTTPNEGAANSGAAYVFVRSGGSWVQQAYLKASNTEANDQFGSSVAISGNTIVVGAPVESSSTTGVNTTPDEGAPSSGAAYVFVRSGGTWSQQAYLKASNTGAGDQFGSSVAVSGDTVLIGALQEDSSSTGVNSTPDEGAPDSGAAYVFLRSAGNWAQQAYLKASNTGQGDRFANSVGLSGDTLAVGAAQEDSSTTGVNSAPDEAAIGSGAAYVFERSGVTWTQQAYLKASNTAIGALFGWSVAISGDTVVVGSLGENSSTTGVNSTPDSAASNAGAAYVFERTGAIWAQQAYLKASNTGAVDQFGESVAIADNTVVVGAPFEDSGTTGVNSTPDESASNSGAAYVFVRSGTTWRQLAYLKASNTGAGDAFGIAGVGVSGQTVVVDSINEDSSSTGVNSTPDEAANASGAAYVFEIPAPSIVLSPASLPTGTAGSAYSQGVNASGGAAPYTYTLTGTLPVGLSFAADTLSGTPSEAGSFPIGITAQDTDGFTATANYTLLINPPTLTLTPGSLPNAQVGVMYNQTLSASGGVAPYGFTLTGSLPAGMTLSSAGLISGVPTSFGAFNFSVTVTDSTPGTAATLTQNYGLIAEPTILIDVSGLPAAAQAGVPYSGQLIASGGTAPYGFVVTGGALPSGLSLSGSGAVTGTPTTPGSFTATITATDAQDFTAASQIVILVGAAGARPVPGPGSPALLLLSLIILGVGLFLVRRQA